MAVIVSNSEPSRHATKEIAIIIAFSLACEEGAIIFTIRACGIVPSA
jgi:hypothetical protein